MDSYKFNTRKFSKKKSFLQFSLSQFLFWREFKSTDCNPKQTTESKTNLGDSLFCMSQSQTQSTVMDRSRMYNMHSVVSNTLLTTTFSDPTFFSTSKVSDSNMKREQFGEKTLLKNWNSSKDRLDGFDQLPNTVFQNLKTQVSSNNRTGSFGQFFPHRQTFVYYWLFPFIGLIGLTYFNQNNPNHIYSSVNLLPFFNQPFGIKKDAKNLTNSISKESVNIVSNKDLHLHFQDMIKLDQQNIENWWRFYFAKTQNQIFLRNGNSSFSSLKFDSNTIDSILQQHFYNRSHFYWRWYSLTNRTLFKEFFFNKMGDLPKKIFPDTYTKENYNRDSKTESQTNILLQGMKDSEPIQSYQKASLLLDHFTRKMQGLPLILKDRTMERESLQMNTDHSGKHTSSNTSLKFNSDLLTQIDLAISNSSLSSTTFKNENDIFKSKQSFKKSKISDVNQIFNKDLNQLFFKKIGQQKQKIQHHGKSLKPNLFLKSDLLNQLNDLMNYQKILTKLPTRTLSNLNSTKKLLKTPDFSTISLTALKTSTKTLKSSIYELILLRQLKAGLQKSYRNSPNVHQQTLWEKQVFYTPTISNIRVHYSKMKYFKKVLGEVLKKQNLNEIDSLSKTSLLENFVLERTGNKLNSPLKFNSPILISNWDSSLDTIAKWYRLQFQNKIQDSFTQNNFLSPFKMMDHSESFLYNKSTISLTPHEQVQNLSIPSIVQKDTLFKKEKFLKESETNLQLANSTDLDKNNFKLLKFKDNCFSAATSFKDYLKEYLIMLNQKLSVGLEKEQIKLLDQHKLTLSLMDQIYNKKSVIRLIPKNESKNLKKYFLVKNLENRKMEKVFRTYLSCKSKNYFLNSSLIPLSNRNVEGMSDNEVSSLFGNGKMQFWKERSKWKEVKKNTLISPYVAYTLKRIKNRLKTTSHQKYDLNLFSLKNSYLLKKESLSKIQFVGEESWREQDLVWKKFLNQDNNTWLNQKSVEQQNRISPNFLNKMGFIFFQQLNPPFLEKRKLETLERVNRLKYQQKKRRRKKLKLENRRRKKRKRFYPRPKWLRFNLYTKFLKIRHCPVFKEREHQFPKGELGKTGQSSFNFKKDFRKGIRNNPVLFFKKNPGLSFDTRSKQYFGNVFKRNVNSKRIQNSGFKIDHQKLNFKIYRQSQQKWAGSVGYSTQTNLEKRMIQKFGLMSKLPIYENHHLYQISNTVMSDFQRLCWKSYWLRSNLTPYIQRIQTSLKEIQKSQSEWNAIQSFRTFFYELLGLKSINIFSIFSPYSKVMFSKSNNSFIAEPYILNPISKDFSVSKRKSSSLMWYLNVKNSLDPNVSFPDLSLFQQTQNVAEYQRILYERISDVIKNVKSNLNVNGQSHARSFKRGRIKGSGEAQFLNMAIPNPSGIKGTSAGNKDKIVSNHFWSRLGRQFNPEIQAFSIFASSIDSSIKPYGELPTLRVLWALNHTNMLSFQPNNEVQTLWSTVKKREQNKSNKTKRFLSKSWKKIFPWFTSMQTPFANPVFLKSEQTSLPEVGKQNPITVGPGLINELDHQLKLSFFCFKKVNSTSQKLQFLGVSNENYKEHLRNLKMKWKSKWSTNSLANQQKNESFFENLPETSFSVKHVATSPQKLMKNHSHFWWSRNFSPSLNSENFVLEFRTLPNNSLTPVFESTPLKNAFYFGSETSFFNSKVLDWKQSFQKETNTNIQIFQSDSFLIANTFWMCLTLFHICCLFALFRIPEIRSLIKFHLLIITKIMNSYLTVIYSIYQSLENQQKQLMSILRHFKNKSSLTSPYHPWEIPKISSLSKDTLEKRISNGVSENISFSFNNAIVEQRKFSNWEQFWNNSYKTTTVFGNSKSISLSNSTKIGKFSNTNLFEITFREPGISNLWLNHSISVHNSHRASTLNFQVFIQQKNLSKIVSMAFLENSVKHIFMKKRLWRIFTIQNLKIQSLTSLFILFLARFSSYFIYQSIQICYTILLKILDFFESIMFIIYKFLEKPAELMVDWIAQIFLVEWSSDITSYVPESLDLYIWHTFKKLWRGNRVFGFVGFLVERRFWCFLEIFIDSITKPDSDLIVRQKKGMIFWDIWAEILIQAAENYQINIPSLTTLKEEQERLIERLLEDQNWTWCQSSMQQLTPLIQIVHPQRPKQWEELQLFDLLNNQMNYLQQDHQFHKMHLYRKKEKRFFDKSFLHQNKETLTSPKNSLDYSKTLSLKTSFIPNIVGNKKQTQFGKTNEIWRRWSVNQYFTSQGLDTDLFVDLHLPKSFSHVTTLKYYEPIQTTLGSLVCQIYSGLFSKQVSKNILVVGAPGTGKSLLIQALAGETELKMISDHAHRYAYVQRGVAVGMKMLREVFDAIALYTPCLFLMEDIHLIGERRPMLISDDENVKATEQSFTGDNEEVHEKNQMIYQLNRHSIAHYKRPYKGDFSLLIPTNHFCFDLFLGISPPRMRRTGLSPKSPLPVEAIEKEINQTNDTDTERFNNDSFSLDSRYLTSCLQFVSEKLFAPPATSPFTILVMKEQKKLKTRKLVKEMPWGGLSWDQMMLIPKVTYSIRVKVAMLADIAISNLSVKLDMITDLLVIMDSVRSNRGFVVFATTHIPYILDPALRRPGRLDETISLPLFPNFLNRWQIFKSNLANFSSTIDFVDYSTLLSNLNESEISHFISKTKLLLLNNNSVNNIPSFIHKKADKYAKFPVYSLNQAMKFKTHSEIVQAPQIIHRKRKSEKRWLALSSNNAVYKTRKNNSLLKLLRNFDFYPSIPPGSSHMIAMSYFQVSKFFIYSKFPDPTHTNSVLWSKFQGFTNINHQREEVIFRELYSTPADFKNHLILLFAGKVGEFFLFNNSATYFQSSQHSKTSMEFSNKNKGDLKTEKILSTLSNLGHENWWNSLQTYQHQGLWSLAGLDEFWQSATSFVFSLVQKRFLYHQNLLVSRMMYFEDMHTLKEPPSPPGSSILMPAKKYENFQRTAHDFQEKSVFSIQEKIQMHQQQRMIKKLYHKPITEYFRSEMISNRLTSFTSSFKELGYLDSFVKRPSSSNAYYTNRIITRQKFSLINQWWNGQLEEHNAETTFLSDVDWRSMFVESLGDLVIDFPDADQHYNPKKRRWFLQSSYWGYWLTFERVIPYEIYSHFMINAFNQAYHSLDSEREILDYLAFIYLKKGILKEIDLITIKSRFYSKNDFDHSH